MKTTLVPLLIGCALAQVAGLTAAGAKELRLYFGTYTGPRSRGIYLARFESSTGRLSVPELVAETKNPSFLALHPNRRFLYAVGEVGEFAGKKGGVVSAFRIDPATGQLAPVNQQSSGGAGPCHVAVDASGQCVLAANYGSGSIAALPIAADGALAPAASVIQHEGSSVNPQRQAGPHAHFIRTDPRNRFALACDLGLDKLLVYRLTPAEARLLPNDVPFLPVAPGSGPRHFAFHPKGRFLYLINEMASTITVAEYDAARGSLKEIQTISTLASDFKAQSSCAEVQVHPSGKFVYGSNRGEDTIAVFAVDQKTGRLSAVSRQSSGGRTPRHFTLDPAGAWLIAENQDSNNVVVFRVDKKTGALTPTGQTVELGSPVCAVFF